MNFVSVPVAPVGQSAESQGYLQTTEALPFACPVMSGKETEHVGAVPGPSLTNLSLPSQLDSSILVPYGADSQGNPSTTTGNVAPPITYTSAQETPVKDSQGIPTQRQEYSPITHPRSPTPQPSSGENEPNDPKTPGSFEPQIGEGAQPLPWEEIDPF